MFNLMIADLVRKKFEFVLPFSLMLAPIILFLSGLLGSIKIGYFLLTFLIIIFSLHKLWDFYKKKQLFLNRNFFYNRAFWIIFLVFVLIVIINYNKGFNQWDDYMHWGPMVKYNLLFDKLYCNADGFAFAHKDYPPIASLYETLWCLIAGHYSEAICIQSLQFLSISFLIPIILNNKKILQTVISTFVVFTMWMILPNLSSFFYSTLYVDTIISVVFGYGVWFVLYCLHDKIDYLFFVILGIFLVLLKQIGLAFYLLLVLIFVLKNIVYQKEKKIIKLAIIEYCGTLLPFVFYFIWNTYVKLINVSGELIGQFSYADLKLFEIMNIIIGKSGEAWQNEASRNYLQALFDKPLITYPISFSFIQAMLLLNIFWLLAIYFAKDDCKKKKIGLFVFDVGAVGYVVGMLLLYTFAFGSYEGPILASYERYMSSYILSGIIFMILANHSKKQLIIWLMTILVFVPIRDYKMLKPTFTYSSWGDEVKKFADYVDERTEDDAKILMISQGEKNIHNFIVAYYLMPTKINGYSFGIPKYEGDVYSVEISQEEFDNLIKQNDYLYVYNFDEYSNELLKDYVDINEVGFSTLFKIENDRLKLVE